MSANFWSYQDAFTGMESEMFSPPHICAIILAVVIVIVCSIWMRKKPREQVKLFLKVMSIIIILMETAYFIWAFINSKRVYGTPDYGAILPIYTCSLINYTLLGAAWGKGKVERSCLAYLVSMGLITGASGIFLVNGLRYYPFWTYDALDSFTYHFLMLLVSSVLIVTEYYKPKWQDALYAFIPILCLSIIAIPVDYHFKADYMLLYEGYGAPVLPSIAKALAGANLRVLYTVFALLIYIPISALMIAVVKGIHYLIDRKGGI